MTGQDTTEAGAVVTAPASAVAALERLIASQTDEIEHLRDELRPVLDQQAEERRRHDKAQAEERRIVAGLMARLPQLTEPMRHDVTGPANPDMAAATPATPEEPRRPWWRFWQHIEERRPGRAAGRRNVGIAEGKVWPHTSGQPAGKLSYRTNVLIRALVAGNGS